MMINDEKQLKKIKNKKISFTKSLEIVWQILITSPGKNSLIYPEVKDVLDINDKVKSETKIIRKTAVKLFRHKKSK